MIVLPLPVRRLFNDQMKWEYGWAGEILVALAYCLYVLRESCQDHGTITRFDEQINFWI